MQKDIIPEVFIDTNVWFSAFYGSATCSKVIDGHLTGKINAIISQRVLKELIKNIQKKIPAVTPIFQKTFINVPPRVVSDPVEIEEKIKKLVDIKDQKIFCSAWIIKARYFVTGNIKHFQVKKLEKLTDIKILTPKQAMDLFHL